MTRQRAPKPWDEAYRRKGRLWGGDRLDGWTRALLDERRVPAPAPATDHRWLDLACGDGKGLVPLTRCARTAPAAHAATVSEKHAPGAPAASTDGPPLVGMDLVQHALRLARDRVDHSGSDAATGLPPPTGSDVNEARRSIPLVRGDMRAIPFDARSFGVVRAVHAVGHLRASERVEAWAEVRRVLRDDGRVIVTEFAIGDLRDGAGDEVEPRSFVRAPGILTHYYDEDEVVREMAAGGLRCIEVRRESHPFKVCGETAQRARVVALAAPDLP